MEKSITRTLLDLAEKYGIKNPMEMTVLDFCTQLATRRYGEGAHEHTNTIMLKVEHAARTK